MKIHRLQPAVGWQSLNGGFNNARVKPTALDLTLVRAV
jgi:hypothetical protein